MPYVRRIAQGLLVAFTVSTALPPMPAWALRQKEAAQVDDTKTGLEEGLTGKPTTINRREFLNTVVKGGTAAAVGAVAGGTVASALVLSTEAPVTTTTFDATTGRPITSVTSTPGYSVPQAAAITGSALVGAALAGGAALWYLAPADAEKVLAERLSTVVGDVQAARSDKQLLVFVDREVADVGLQQLDFRTIPGYPNVAVVPLPPFTEASDLVLQHAQGQHVINIVAEATRVPPLGPNQSIVRVLGLNHQRIVDSLLPVLVTEAIAQWHRGGESIDVASYGPLRDLTVNQVWQVLSSQFA